MAKETESKDAAPANPAPANPAATEIAPNERVGTEGATQKASTTGAEPPPGTAGATPKFEFVGVAGGIFNIRGKFGDKGMVSVSGRQVDLTSWTNQVIKGFLPPDIGYGEVIVSSGDGRQQKGHWGPVEEKKVVVAEVKK